jgi:hypothetical protein
MKRYWYIVFPARRKLLPMAVTTLFQNTILLFS